MMIFDCYLGWTHDTLKKHFIKYPAQLGQELLVSAPYASIYQYWLVQVEDPDFGRFHKIRVNQRFGWHSRSDLFFRNGKLDCEPTGQVMLLPYDALIGRLIKERKQEHSENGGHIELSDQIINQTGLIKCMKIY